MVVAVVMAVSMPMTMAVAVVMAVPMEVVVVERAMVVVEMPVPVTMVMVEAVVMAMTVVMTMPVMVVANRRRRGMHRRQVFLDQREVTRRNGVGLGDRSGSQEQAQREKRGQEVFGFHNPSSVCFYLERKACIPGAKFCAQQQTTGHGKFP